jgi:hypothetical protein
MTFSKKLKLGLKMVFNITRIPSGSIYTSHLVMALKIFETPPEIKGDIIECGTWKGNSAANLSLVCKITNRKLIIFDSFEGLPEPKEGDIQAQKMSKLQKGAYDGTLEEVKKNITKYGDITSCEFVKGWFEQTLPNLNSPVLLANLDIDLDDSLNTCMKCVWPNLIDKGYIFIDECLELDYVALFFSEKWWQKNFNCNPPGLIGAGTGLPLGTFYIGPYSEYGEHPLQKFSTGAYTRKDFSGVWSYYPEEK